MMPSLDLFWATFALGCVFGVAARAGNFCLLRGLRQTLAHPVCRHVATNPGGIVHVVYRRSRHHLFQKPETLLRE